MFDTQRMFHVGVLVADLDRAMQELATASDLTWAEPRSVDAMPVWTPDGGAREEPIRFVYSCAGPQHVELLQGAPGSPWYAGDAPGLHHVGLWTDDVARDVTAAAAQGWAVELANVPPEDGFGMFAYVRPPSGLLVEFVSDALLPSFEEWWDTRHQ